MAGQSRLGPAAGLLAGGSGADQHRRDRLAEPGPWRERIRAVRYNASVKSHAELDEATELDDGDPELLASAHTRLRPLLPELSVLGGCCGTDTRHVAALWGTGR